jgi:hypothetical protein
VLAVSRYSPNQCKRIMSGGKGVPFVRSRMLPQDGSYACCRFPFGRSPVM